MNQDPIGTSLMVVGFVVALTIAAALIWWFG